MGVINMIAPLPLKYPGEVPLKDMVKIITIMQSRNRVYMSWEQLYMYGGKM